MPSPRSTKVGTFHRCLTSFEGLDEFQHEVVDHAVEDVREEVYTNELENFGSLVSMSRRSATTTPR